MNFITRFSDGDSNTFPNFAPAPLKLVGRFLTELESLIRRQWSLSKSKVDPRAQLVAFPSRFMLFRTGNFDEVSLYGHPRKFCSAQEFTPHFNWLNSDASLPCRCMLCANTDNSSRYPPQQSYGNTQYDHANQYAKTAYNPNHNNAYTLNKSQATQEQLQSYAATNDRYNASKRPNMNTQYSAESKRRSLVDSQMQYDQSPHYATQNNINPSGALYQSNVRSTYTASSDHYSTENIMYEVAQPAVVAEVRSNWDDSQFRISEMVWVPVLLQLKETRSMVQYDSSGSLIDITPFQAGFQYWPAIIQNIFSLPYRELWSSPLHVEDLSDGNILITSELYSHITSTNIPYAYALKLINLETNDEPILAQDDIIPFVAFDIPKSIFSLSQDDALNFKHASNDCVLSDIIQSYIHSKAISQKLQRLDEESKTNIFSNVNLKPYEFEIISFLYGAEVIKVDDVVRVKVKSSDANSFDQSWFGIRAIVLNKQTDDIFVHGYKQSMQECPHGTPGSFIDGKESCMWVQNGTQVFQIRIDRVLGRFYTHYPAFDLSKRINIVKELVG